MNKSILKKESRVYENILDFPRFVMNEILTEWKPYQVLKSHDKKVQNLQKYIAMTNAMHEIDDNIYHDLDPDNFYVKEIKFIDKTVYLVQGVNAGYTKQSSTFNTSSAYSNIFRYLEDGNKNTIILYVDPIKNFYLNPRTIVSKDLKTYDKEWLETETDKCLYSWFHKVYSDLREFVADCYSEYQMYTVDKNCTITLDELLVKSIFVWYYSNDLEEGNDGIIKTNMINKYDPSNIIMMILMSLSIYPLCRCRISKSKDIESNIVNSTNRFANTIKLSKVFTTEEFKDADILTRSIMIKEKEFEINHD